MAEESESLTANRPRNRGIFKLHAINLADERRNWATMGLRLIEEDQCRIARPNGDANPADSKPMATTNPEETK